MFGLNKHWGGTNVVLGQPLVALKLHFFCLRLNLHHGGSIFFDTYIVGTSMLGTNITEINIVGSNITGINIVGTNIDGTDIGDTNISGTNIKRSWV